MKKRFNFFLLCFFQFVQLHAQEPGCGLRITLLTCAPGTELYSTFGHTAIRVQDSLTGGDQVFNYGTFEFEPGFYVKFIRGKLMYSLAVENFEDFLYTYQYESRSIVEQELILNCEQKKELFTALMINSREENRYYRYDFLYDNCTTRARDMVKKQAGVNVVFRNILGDEKPSFRNLIHSYLDAGEQHWSKLGIDILLGARLDRKVTNEEAMFLPDYLLKGFDSASTGSNSALVKPVQKVLTMPAPFEKGFRITPFMVFAVLLIIIGFISLKGNRNSVLLKTFDRIFFFLLGFTGLFLLFMWFGTDHRVARDNLNLLWAWPTHIYVAFVVNSKRKWLRNYFRFNMILSILLLLCWFFLPQQLNPALIPIVLILVIRTWVLSKY